MDHTFLWFSLKVPNFFLYKTKISCFLLSLILKPLESFITLCFSSKHSLIHKGLHFFHFWLNSHNFFNFYMFAWFFWLCMSIFFSAYVFLLTHFYISFSHFYVVFFFFLCIFQFMMFQLMFYVWLNIVFGVGVDLFF